MTEAIAIDFGTTRTKVAYWDERTRASRLVHLGYGDKPQVPSLFYLARDSERISWGYDADELLEEDPAGIVEVLKRRLQDRYVYANRRKVSPRDLLTLMFSRLREQVGQEVLALNGTAPAKACLTLPALYGPAVEKLLREAARAADFTDVELIAEPVAAAQAWLTEAGETGRSVVVLDCGGGTLDLAYLGYEDGRFRIVPECPPGGDTHVGGHDVDRELLNLIREQVPDAAEELEDRQPFYLRQVRTLKERYCRNLPVRALKVAGQTLELSAEDIQSVLQERFIEQTCENLKAYMARVVALTGGEQPPVLLVGGSARIKGLKEAIEAQGDYRTLRWERSEFATVLGAVSVPTRDGFDAGKEPRSEPVDPVRIRDELAWKRALRRDEPDGYRVYLQDPHPARAHDDEARARLEAAAWRQARDGDTPEAYRAYLQTDDLRRDHDDQARVRMDDLLWEAAESADTPAAYAAYLADEGLLRHHAPQARVRQDDLAWETARADDTPTAYDTYLADEGLARHHREEAQAAILALDEADEAAWREARRQDTTQAYRAYLDKTAQPRAHAAKAEERLRRIAEDQAAWEAASERQDPAAYRAYLADPSLLRRHRSEAEKRIAAFERAAAERERSFRGALERQRRAAEKLGKPVVFRDAAFDVRQNVRFRVREASWFRDAEYETRRVELRLTPPEMVVIPPGTFLMGSPEDEPGRFGDEGPQHQVTLTKPFALARYALTFAEYDAYCAATGKEKPNDEGWGRGKCPVVNVSWDDAASYCQWLSEQTGAEYRLPSEAEWEYACRAGTTTPFWWGDTIAPRQANYDGNYPYNNGPKGEYREKSVPVDAFEPNPWGLYQMHGNVREWVRDQFASYSGEAQEDPIYEDSGSSRVLRGGSWFVSARYLRAAFRSRNESANRFALLGLRPARTL